MYKCKHNTSNKEWCDDCRKIRKCDCSTTETDNGYVNYGELSREIEVLIDYCPVCFQVKQVRY